MTTTGPITVRRSVCPHDCPDTCAMLVHIRDGRIVNVTGNPDHPTTRGAICGKAHRYAERVYSAERLPYPLRRSGPKGSDRWERIGWDEAVATVAAEFRRIVRDHGAEAILPYSFAGTEGTVNKESLDRRFFNRLGACRLERAICSAAGSAGYGYTMTGGRRGTDPEETVHARYLISWGANLASANLHQMTMFQEARRRGAKHVVIDVHRNRTAKLADWFIPIRPGTDTALALGLMHVIIGEGLYDKEYVAAETVGFEHLAARAAKFPPERVERITGVPAADVTTLAREYARTRPSFIRIGNGPQHHSNGGMIVRTVACLPGLVGAWRDVGGGAIKSNGDYFQLNLAALARDDLAPTPRPRTINMNQLGHALTDLEPPIYGLFVYNSNPLVVAPDQAAIRRGLLREDLFTVVHEQLMTDTARYADIVLPATTHFEHLDLYPSYWHLYLQIAEPVIDRVGESKPNIEVFQLLAKALGFEDPCFDDTPEDIIRQALDNPANPLLQGITLESLREQGWQKLQLTDRTPFAPGHGKLGKVAFYSERLAQLGHDPVPTYEPPAEIGDGATGPEDARYPLGFITPPSHFFLNSTYADMPGNQRAEGRPTLQIHPRDAAARGIAEGDLVRVFNDRGACHLYAAITDATLPGQVVSQGLWWGKWTPDGNGVNVTTPQRLADFAGGATFFSNAVQVERAGPEA
ncbi:MAG TPA: molybdopterin oxidoreductase family protein [Dehalococcoidia bacterium]|nr:molybdopterin oxidoreductase family protein [Dehalococcoidia bacterium]